MRNRFTRGFSVLAASAAITTSLGFAAAGAASASTPGPHVKNATLTCGASCVSLASKLLGANWIGNAKGGATGTSINLRAGGNTRVNEDFVVNDAGSLIGATGLCTATVPAISISSYTCVHYGVASSVVHAFELEFAPNGITTGDLCLGVSSAASAQRISLQTCGTVKTFWVGDSAHNVAGAQAATASTCAGSGVGTAVCPLIAASDTAITNPLVLTVNTDSKRPPNVLRVDREELSGAVVPDLQQFSVAAGPWVHVP